MSFNEFLLSKGLDPSTWLRAATAEQVAGMQQEWADAINYQARGGEDPGDISYMEAWGYVPTLGRDIVTGQVTTEDIGAALQTTTQWAAEGGQALAETARDAAKAALSIIPWYVWAGGIAVVGAMVFLKGR